MNKDVSAAAMMISGLVLQKFLLLHQSRLPINFPLIASKKLN
jgi:hypothetical protein